MDDNGIQTEQETGTSRFFSDVLCMLNEIVLFVDDRFYCIPIVNHVSHLMQRVGCRSYRFPGNGRPPACYGGSAAAGISFQRRAGAHGRAGGQPTCRSGRADRGQHLLWRRISQSEIRNSAAEIRSAFGASTKKSLLRRFFGTGFPGRIFRVSGINFPTTYLYYLNFSAPRVGVEPTTVSLTASCSAIELPRS